MNRRYKISRFFKRNALNIQALLLLLFLLAGIAYFFAYAFGDEKPERIISEKRAEAIAPSSSSTSTSSSSTSTIPPSTAPPSTAPAKPAPKPAIEWDGSNLCSLVSNYDWPQDVAYRVCIQESGGNPNNQNLNDYHSFADCWGSFGLMQINCAAKINHFDPHENMAQAYSMWRASGWTPWKNTCAKVGC